MSYEGTEKLHCPACGAIVDDVTDIDWKDGTVDDECAACGQRLRLVRRLSVTYEIWRHEVVS